MAYGAKVNNEKNSGWVEHVRCCSVVVKTQGYSPGGSEFEYR